MVSQPRMPASIFNAPQYDPERERRRRNRIVTIIVLLVVILIVAWRFRYWSEERLVSHFFQTLQNKDYEGAYAIWMHDPQWKQHPPNSRYTYADFYEDWGPGGEWGLITSYHVDVAGVPRGGGSGVIVVVTVNQRAEKARIWVEKRDKTLGFPPD